MKNYTLLSALTLVLGQPVFAAEMPAMPMDKMPMNEMQMEQSGAMATAQASGTVKAIDSQKGSVTKHFELIEIIEARAQLTLAAAFQQHET